MFEQVQRPGPYLTAFAGVMAIILVVSLFIEPLILLPFLIIVGLVVWMFSALKVTVGQGVLEWRFRGGIPTKRLQLTRIVSAEVVTIPWRYGIGIRRVPEGWLYNMRGGKAVKVTDRDGKVVFLGSDAPDALVAAIHSRLGTSRS